MPKSHISDRNGFPMRHLRDERAKLVTDLLSNMHDVRLAADCLDRLIPLVRDRTPDLILLRSLWITSVVSYFRAFAGGCRKLIPKEVIERLPETEQATHNRIKDIRDKHIAHPVNSFEEFAVLLELDVHQLFLITAHHTKIRSECEGLAVLCEWRAIIGKIISWLDDELQREMRELYDWLDTLEPQHMIALPIFLSDPEEINADPSAKRTNKPNLDMLHRLIRESQSTQKDT